MSGEQWNNDTAVSAMEPAFLLMSGQFRQALAPLGLARAITTLVELWHDSSLGNRVFHNAQRLGQANRDFQDFLSAPSDFSEAFRFHKALFTILNSAGFPEPDIRAHLKTVGATYLENLGYGSLSADQAEKYKQDIEKALKMVYHSEATQ